MKLCQITNAKRCSLYLGLGHKRTLRELLTSVIRSQTVSFTGKTIPKWILREELALSGGRCTIGKLVSCVLVLGNPEIYQKKGLALVPRSFDRVRSAIFRLINYMICAFLALTLFNRTIVRGESPVIAVMEFITTGGSCCCDRAIGSFEGE